MTPRRVWIVGAGKRVRETALPAFLSLPGSFEIAAILARSARGMETDGRRFAVSPLSDLRAGELAQGDLFYVAVGKDAVPAVLGVLARLAGFDRASFELLVDTPVLRFKHLRHRGLLWGWHRAGVAEDTAYLPWYEAARAAAGRIERVLFDRSAYAYHGLAQGKALCRSHRVLRARRAKFPDGRARREIELEGGARLVAIEPRDYTAGRVVVEGSRGLVADRLEAGESGVLLEPIVERGSCAGFRAGELSTRLSPEEAALTAGDPPGARVTARMESMKRVGFRRLLESVAAGNGAYPVDEGLEDMAVDWFLERFGRWRPGALTSLSSPLARGLWSAIGRLG